MKQIIKKIYTILVLIKNVLFRHKHYTLHFIAEKDDPIKLWYYDFKHWGFDHHNLLMVSGADDLCELYANGKDEVTVNIIASRKMLDENKTNDYDMFCAEKTKFTSISDNLLYGRTYTNTTVDEEGELHVKTMWICPVTLFVLGRYPKYIYIKNENNNN